MELPESLPSPRFSSDGAHVVVVFASNGKHAVWLDGAEVARHDSVNEVVLAPDGSWMSLLVADRRAQSGTQQTEHMVQQLVHRGVTTELPDDARELTVSPSGAHIAYTHLVGSGESSQVVLDNKPLGAANDPRLLTLSEDGSRFAYTWTVSRYKGGARVTVDRVTGPVYHAVWGLSFSPDGKHVAYLVYKGDGSAAVVVDGKEGKRYHTASENPRFTVDGKIVYDATSEAGAVLVVGTKEYGPYAHVGPVALSGDSVAWAVETLEGARGNERIVARVFIDGREVWSADVGQFSRVADRGPSVDGLVLSAKSGRAAFTSAKGTIVAAQGAPSLELPPSAPIAFDAFGNRLAARVPLSRMSSGPSDVSVRVSSLTEGGVALGPDGPELSEVYGATLRFSPNADEIRYFARRGRTLVRVEQPAK
jgi:hypothetical protein